MHRLCWATETPAAGTAPDCGYGVFLFIINGFVKFVGCKAGFIPMTTSARPEIESAGASRSGFEPDNPESDFTPLTAEQARQLRDASPNPSPWWVIAAQVVAGLVAAGVSWVWTGRPVVPISMLYGALAVAIPAALFVWGALGASQGVQASAAMVRFFVWEWVKLLLTVAMLAAAPWLIRDLSWLALLAGVVVAMKMYWVALVVRPKLLNRI